MQSFAQVPLAAPRRRVLFVADDVTLAHAVRPMVLAKALRAAGYDVRLAMGGAYGELLCQEGIEAERIASISPAEFQDILWKNQAIYPVERLRRFLADDLRLLERH